MPKFSTETINRYFEIAGTCVGLLACASVASQVYAEFSTTAPSTLSYLHTIGFLIMFAFWTAYGLRFGRIAVWLTNGIATCIQTLLLVAVLLKSGA